MEDQKVTGIPGSTSATTRIDGSYLPPRSFNTQARRIAT
jgi:hypothetical protein